MAPHHFRWFDNTGCDRILNVSTINNGWACTNWLHSSIHIHFFVEWYTAVQNYLNPMCTLHIYCTGWGEFLHKSSTLKKPYMDRYRFDDFSSSLLLNAFLFVTLGLIFSMARVQIAPKTVTAAAAAAATAEVVMKIIAKCESWTQLRILVYEC